MTGITLILLFLLFPLCVTEEHVVNELYTLIEKGQGSVVDPAQNNQTRLVLKLVAPVSWVLGSKPPASPMLFSLLCSIKRSQKHHQDTQTSISPPQQSETEGNANSKPRAPNQTQTLQTAVSPHRELPNRRQDPEENRPGKSGLYQSGISAATWNNSRPPVHFNRRSSSLLYLFDVLRRESDYTHDAFCLSECRKEKDEKEYYCFSEFAVNGIIHDIDILRKGVRLVTLMVSSDGFYKMSRLYVTPETFFFKVRLLVLDTYKCSKPCPDIKLGTRYIVMGQIYHRRRPLPSDLLTLVGGKLKPGDGLLQSNHYVKRFNKRRHQKALEATRSRCR
uniref:Procollagen C-endopeptidase enhancer n=1 Tax=Nothobranchius korthausae TaxID=1143690 RepID=A0A1A8ETV3_9TELE